ncbi:MAG: rhomboid family intramembrane serine protease [Candidatus Thermoplasmatota archaeon]|nr:rhomboid family intramembrane serine protease [Candidatus Thermoplasmatota archaeon]
MADFFSSTPSVILLLVIAISFVLAIVLPWKKKASATMVISISIIAVFVIDLLMTSEFLYNLPFLAGHPPFDRYVVLRNIGFFPRSIVDDYTVFQFITSTYMHADFMHLMFNTFGLIILGTQLEQRIGWERFLVIYFGSGVIAGAVVLFISPFGYLGHTMNTVSIGASGCIFGILGALWYLYPRDEIFFPLIIIRKWPISLIVLIYGGMSALFILLNTDDEVSHIAHFAGLVGSFPIAFLVKARKDDKKEKGLDKLTKEQLTGLTSTKRQKLLLDRALSSDEKDVRDAWLEEFFSSVNCPKCKGRGMNYDGKDATCSRCGKRIRP